MRYDWPPVIRLIALTGLTYLISWYIPWGPLVYTLPVRISLYIAYLILVWFAGVVSADDRAAALRTIGQFLTSTAARAALRARSGGCEWPKCDRPVAFTNAHHLVHWGQGGSTDVENLVNC